MDVGRVAQRRTSFMVLALSKGNGLLALRPKVAAKWLAAYATHGPKAPRHFPAEKLDEFLNLYAKVKDPAHFSVPFPATPRQDQSLARLNEFRNDFIHFTPKGWSIELGGLPNIVIDTSDVISWCTNDAESFVWYKTAHAKQTASAVRRLKRVMKMLNEKYNG